MWPSKWIRDDVEIQALLERWRGTRLEVWEYSCSHARLLIRLIREKENMDPVASAYLFCHGCQSVRFDDGWRGMDVHIKRASGSSGSACVVTDRDRLHIVCRGVSAVETAVIPFINLNDQLRG